MTRSLNPLSPVLIVEDEPETLRSYTLALRLGGINHIIPCLDSREVFSHLSSQPIKVMLLDLLMPHMPGEEILLRTKQEFPEIPVIVITGIDEVDTAVRCMKKGALDYMVKPVELPRLVSGVKRAIEVRALQDENRLLKERLLSGTLHHPEAFAPIITRNKAMFSIFQYIESIAPSRQPVLITGETGVGKELLVKAIHNLSTPDKPLVSVNVAGIDDTVFSDTLFGHVKGAFTDAGERRAGLVERAFKGTLYLDEIGDLSPESQIKLLRLLQEGEYFPIGSDVAKKAETRVIVTTNKDFHQILQQGLFRKDLFYRLSIHQIHLPPLRQRPEDLPLLVDHFLEKASRSLGKEGPDCPEGLVSLLTAYAFPGNVRELQSMIYDAVSRNQSGRLSAKEFKGLNLPAGKPFPSRTSPPGPPDSYWRGAPDPLPTLEDATNQIIREALKRFNENQSLTARALGISRQRLARYLKRETR
jgi:DNA-binding NtrC family response regulator